MSRLSYGVLVATLVLACCLGAGKSEEVVVDPNAYLGELILPYYETHRRHPSDTISSKYPHVLEVSLRDVFRIELCDGWLTQVWVPTSWEPPYYGGNHHFEYWGIVEKEKHFLGEGASFGLVQDIEMSGFRRLLADACRTPYDGKWAATTYVRMVLAGRIPLESKDSTVPLLWRWITSANDVPAGWLDECMYLDAIPPKYEVWPDGSVYRGCFLAKIDLDHNDVGCWEFRFDTDTRITEAKQLFRRQSKPGFPSDLRGTGFCLGE